MYIINNHFSDCVFERRSAMDFFGENFESHVCGEIVSPYSYNTLDENIISNSVEFH